METKPQKYKIAHPHNGNYGYEILEAQTQNRVCGDMTAEQAEMILKALNSNLPGLKVNRMNRQEVNNAVRDFLKMDGGIAQDSFDIDDVIWIASHMAKLARNKTLEEIKNKLTGMQTI